MEIENWRAVVGYEGLYEVSDLGRVRSLDRVIEKPALGFWNIRGITLAQHKTADGYLRVKVSRDGKARTVGVHQLVAAAFICPIPFEAAEVNHKDLNKRNNTPGNLEWVSHQKNMDHANANGRGKPILGVKKAPKHSLGLVLEARRLSAEMSLTPAEISEKLNIRITSVWNILNNKSWAAPGSVYTPRRGSAAVHKSKAVKLTLEQVREMRSEYAAGCRQVDLAKKYSVRQCTISAIVRHAIWAE